jgi:hypothetical protein
MKSERMKKFVTGLVALIFGVAVIGFTIKLTYDTMTILFPQDPILRWISIALYDGGVIAWLLTYIARAKGTPQRGIALVMTVLDFLGVVAMVIAGIYLSGQTLADIPPWVGSAVVNVTIIAATLNAGAIYFYHANAPDVIESIQTQELEDTLQEEALDQARMQVERSAQQLGAIIANRVTARMKYRMRLPMTEQEGAEWRGEVVDVQAYDPASLPPPPVQQETFWSAVKSFFGGKQSQQSSATQPLRSSTVSPQELEKIAQSVDARRAWNETPGGRERLWCKDCRDEGRPWLTPEPCIHVQSATAEEIIPYEVAMNTLRRLMNEPVPLTVETAMRDRQSPEPSGMTRPSYNEASYTRKPRTGKEEYDI